MQPGHIGYRFVWAHRLQALPGYRVTLDGMAGGIRHAPENEECRDRTNGIWAQARTRRADDLSVPGIRHFPEDRTQDLQANHGLTEMIWGSWCERCSTIRVATASSFSRREGMSVQVVSQSGRQCCPQWQLQSIRSHIDRGAHRIQSCSRPSTTISRIFSHPFRPIRTRGTPRLCRPYPEGQKLNSRSSCPVASMKTS